MRIKRVIEGGRAPTHCRVTNGAVVRQAQLHMRRIGGVLKIDCVRVAAITVRRRSFVNIIDMACDAGQSGMRPGQRIASVLEVVELRSEPTIHRMAAFARGGEAETLVVDDRRQEVLLMAGIAFRRKALELPRGGVLVALVAFHQGMSTDQRKAVLVIANRI